MTDYTVNLDSNVQLLLRVTDSLTSVSTQLYLVKLGGARFSNYTDNTWSVNVGGATASGSGSYDVRNGNQLLLNVALAPSRNAGSTKAITVSGSFSDPRGLTPAGTASGSFTIAGTPGAPTAGTFTQNSTTAATLTWSAPSANGGAAVTGYRVQYATNSSFTGSTTVTLGNVTSYQITGRTPGSQVFARVAAKNGVGFGGYSATKNVVLVASVGDLDGWSVYGTLPSGMTPLVGTGIRRGSIYSVSTNPTGLLREIQQSSAVSVDATQQGIQRTITGLKVGSTYQLTASISLVQTATQKVYRFGVTGIGTGSSVTLTTAGTVQALPAYTFVATATSHVITIAGASTVTSGSSGYFDAFGVWGLKLTEIPNTSPQRLQDVGLEAPLARHFTIASDTVGGAWWVDTSGVTQFKQSVDDGEIVAIFTDDPNDDGALSYTDKTASYDTKNLINSIKVTNHGYDPATGKDDDDTYTLDDATSIAAYGVRSGSLDTEMRAGYVDVTNLITNPGGELAVTGWVTSTSNATAGTSGLSFGPAQGTKVLTAKPNASQTACGLFYGTSTTVPVINVTAGTTYQFKFQGFCTTNGRQVQARIRWFNASGSVIGSDDTGTPVTLSNAAWSQVAASGTAPVGAVKAAPWLQSIGTWATADVLAVDVATFYADVPGYTIPTFSGAGAYPADTSGDYVFAWTGTADASTSQRTTFKILNDRIKEVIADHNTPTRTISSITFNAQSDPVTAASLDIQDRIRVVFRGQVQDSRIVGIEHKMSGNRWEVELALAAS